MKKGILISFEGPEGSGKSTHLAKLSPYLKQKGHSVLMTREPGGTTLSKGFRKILLDTREPLSSLAELLLYEADRAQHVDELLLPALAAGKTVLCDRFTDSTMAYQGYGRGLDLRTIGLLNQVASRGRKPDLTVLLDVPVEKGLAQAGRRRKGHDRLESAGFAFHKRVRKGFLRLATSEPKRFRVIRQQRDLAKTQELIRRAIDQFLDSTPS